MSFDCESPGLVIALLSFSTRASLDPKPPLPAFIVGLNVCFDWSISSRPCDGLYAPTSVICAGSLQDDTRLVAVSDSRAFSFTLNPALPSLFILLKVSFDDASDVSPEPNSVTFGS